MKKRIIAILLALTLLAALTVPACAYSEKELRTADALYQLGLFLGTGETYALDKTLSRSEGVILLVRMLGKETNALSETHAHPFTDAESWADAYIGFAYDNGLMKGIAADRFGGELVMSEQMFLTVTLRALGYKDDGSSAFSYEKAAEFAQSVHLIEAPDADGVFTRGEAIAIFWTALGMTVQGTKNTLSEQLIAQGAFTKAVWDKAVVIQRNGADASTPTGEKKRKSGGGSSSSGKDNEDISVDSGVMVVDPGDEPIN